MPPETHGAPEARSPGVVLPGGERRARPPRHRTPGGRNPFAGPLTCPNVWLVIEALGLENHGVLLRTFASVCCGPIRARTWDSPSMS